MKRRIPLLFLIAVLITAFFVLDLGSYLNLETLKAQQQAISDYHNKHPFYTLSLYFTIYVLFAAVALPGAVWLTLAGGAIFGLWTGTILISFASSIGALLAFLISRFLLRDFVQDRFKQKLYAVNKGIRKDGDFYLFTLRLVPIFPFWIVNVTMGLTPMHALRFYLVSQIGMLPATIIYVNAGTQLARLDALGDVLSPALFGSLTLLGIFPLLAKKTIELMQARRILRHFDKPARFDRDVIVIGGGSAGLVSAYLAATLRAKVTLVEQKKMGGDCLNTGCVPSKSLLRSARLAHELKNAAALGIRAPGVEINFASIMQRIKHIINTIEPHDSAERYRKLGVDVRKGHARIISPYKVRIGDGETLTTRKIVLATGAEPFVPQLTGLKPSHYSTSETIWDLSELPRRLAVVGGGPIGCELAQGFARLGSAVTLIETQPRLLNREDSDISEIVRNTLEQENIRICLKHHATAVSDTAGELTLHCEHAGDHVSIACDHLLIALGRRARTSGYGLEELGVTVAEDGNVQVNDYLQTNYPNILACGDVAGPYHFTHAAAHQAWYATFNALFGGLKKFRIDYSAVPWATFTDPEVARVGLNEQDAKQQGVDYEVTIFDISELDRAIIDGAANGKVKVLTAPGKDRILGAAIVGEHASEWIIEFITAMRNRIGLNKILQTVHIYPTFAEANKYAAGAWRRNHASQALLSFLERYHRWRRG